MAIIKNGDCCMNCRFWEKTGDSVNGEKGECRKNAPIAYITGDKENPVVAVWPPMPGYEWCGEFENS